MGLRYVSTSAVKSKNRSTLFGYMNFYIDVREEAVKIQSKLYVIQNLHVENYLHHFLIHNLLKIEGFYATLCKQNINSEMFVLKVRNMDLVDKETQIFFAKIFSNLKEKNEKISIFLIVKRLESDCGWTIFFKFMGYAITLIFTLIGFLVVLVIFGKFMKKNIQRK